MKSKPADVSVECKVLSVDFEDNEITLILPEGFWNKYEVRSGTVNLTNISAIVEKGANDEN